MTRDEAIAIRTQQLAGASVAPLVLARALAVIAATNEPTGRIKYERPRQQYCDNLPRLTAGIRSRVNSILLLNLGIAIGRQKGGTA